MLLFFFVIEGEVAGSILGYLSSIAYFSTDSK